MQTVCYITQYLFQHPLNTKDSFFKRHNFPTALLLKIQHFCYDTPRRLYEIIHGTLKIGQSQWPRGLKHGSAAARLVGWWARIPPGALTSVFCECCRVEVSASGRSLAQGSHIDWGVCERDRVAWITRRLWPTKGCCAMKKKMEI
jgi:hypothetical protein